MNGACEHFFARPTLSVEEHGGLRRRGALGELQHFAHSTRLAYDQPVPRLDFAAEDADVASQPPAIECFRNDELQVRSLERLLEEVVRAGLHGTHRRFDTAVGRDQLLRYERTPVIELNRAVAISFAASPVEALELLDGIGRSGDLDSYVPFHLARADVLCRLGCNEEAQNAYRAALPHARNEQIRRFIEQRLRP